MTTHSSLLGAITYATESAFGEAVTTVASRMPALGRVDMSGLSQPKIDPGIMRQRAHEGFHDIRGAFGGTFTVEFLLTGAGASCAGAVPTQTELSKILGYVLGNSAASAASGTTVSTSADADSITSVASGTFAAGSICRVGSLGDGDGEGQAYAVSSHSGTALELLVGMEAAAASSQVIYTGYMHYPSESPTGLATIQSLRVQLHTANEQTLCHGCFPQSISISGLNPSEQPKVAITFSTAWWERRNSTFPVTATHEAAAGMTVSTGSLFINTVGTTTRNRLSVRDFNLSIDLQAVPLMGPGGVAANQAIVGARRTKCQATIDFATDAEAAGTRTADDEWNTGENSAVYKHCMYTLTTSDGRSAAFYFPRLKMVGDRPQQFDLNGLNAIRYRYQALTGGTTTTDLTASNFRVYLG